MAGHESNLCNVRILNYSENNGLYYANAKRVIRHKVSKKKWALGTQSGKCIIVTNDHSLVVFRKGKQVVCKPCEVLLTDMVLTSEFNGISSCYDFEFSKVRGIECIGDFEDEYIEW